MYVCTYVFTIDCEYEFGTRLSYRNSKYEKYLAIWEGPTATVGVGKCRRMFEIQTDLSESLQQSRRVAVASEMDSMCLGIAERNKCRGIA
jgi:hypothetical protein